MVISQLQMVWADVLMGLCSVNVSISATLGEIDSENTVMIVVDS